MRCSLLWRNFKCLVNYEFCLDLGHNFIQVLLCIKLLKAEEKNTQFALTYMKTLNLNLHNNKAKTNWKCKYKKPFLENIVWGAIIEDQVVMFLKLKKYKIGCWWFIVVSSCSKAILDFTPTLLHLVLLNEKVQPIRSWEFRVIPMLCNIAGKMFCNQFSCCSSLRTFCKQITCTLKITFFLNMYRNKRPELLYYEIARPRKLSEEGNHSTQLWC